MRRSRLSGRPTEKRLASELGIGALLFLGILLIYLVFSVSRFDFVTDINALDYAQAARHLYRGEGFTTSFIKPLSLVYHRSVERHPELTYPPLHILTTSAVMHALGPTERAVTHSSGLAFVLTAPLVFLMGLRLFDLRTATLATVFYGANATYLDYAISGLEVSLLSLLLTAVLLLAYLAARAGRREMVFVAAAGVGMGLVYLTKYVWILAAIPIAVYLVTMNPQRRFARLAVFVGFGLIVALPWLVRNYRLTGNPVFTLRTTEVLGQTKAYPGNSLYRQYAEYVPGALGFTVRNPRAMLEKVRSGVAALYRGSAALAGVYLTPFFLVAILVRLGDENFERWRYVIYGSFILVAVTLTFLIAAPRLLVPLGPAMTVIATAYFWRLVDQATGRGQSAQVTVPQGRGRAVTAAVAILLFAHAFPFLVAVTPGRPTTELGPSVVQRACEQIAERTEGAVLTDMPWAVAWLADRDAVWLPQTQVDLRKVEDAVGPFRWMVLTPLLPEIAVAERLEPWAAVWRAALRSDIRDGDFGVQARVGDGRWIVFRRVGPSR